MSVTNQGNQTINWKYKTPLQGQLLAEMFNGCVSPGLYLNSGNPITSGTGIASYTAGGVVTLNPFTAVFNCKGGSGNQTVNINTSTTINMTTAITADGRSPAYCSASQPWITMSYTWANQIAQYIDFAFVSSPGQYDVVIGKGLFSGTMIGIDWSNASYPPTYNASTNTLNLQSSNTTWAVPVGATFTQVPGVPAPATVYGSSSWSNVASGSLGGIPTIVWKRTS